MRAFVCVMILFVATLPSTYAKITVYQNFDIHPEEEPEIYEMELNAEHRSGKLLKDHKFASLDLVKCPGGRHGLDDMWQSCGYFVLERCKNKNYPEKGGCFRNEVGLRDEPDYFPLHKDIWVGFSLYIPEPYTPDRLQTTVYELKANGGRFFSPGSPMLEIGHQHGWWGVWIRGSSECKEFCDISEAISKYVAPVVPGTWIDFIYHTTMSFDHNKPGFARLWMNGELMFEETDILTAFDNPNGYGRFNKWGLYKHQWGEGNHKPFDNDKVQLYMPGIIVSDSKDGFDEVDTRPRCSSVKTCCSSCLKGKANPLFNKARCARQCNKDATDPLCTSHSQGKCKKTKECCKACIKTTNNPLFDPAQCAIKLRAREKKGKSKVVKKYSFASGWNGCDLQPFKCEPPSVCVQSDKAFECKCPNKNAQGQLVYTNNNNNDGFDCRVRKTKSEL